MAEKARQLFSKIVGNVSRAGFGDVEINNRSMKDDLSHGIGMAKAAVIPAIPDVIKNGKQIDFQSQWKGRPYDGYVFAAPVDLDGRKVYVAAIVKQTSKNRFYLHEVVDSDGNIIKINGGEKANPTSLSSVDGTGTSSPPITPTQGVNAETVVSDNSIPTAERNVNSGQAENSGQQRERGFSKNVRTDNAMVFHFEPDLSSHPSALTISHVTSGPTQSFPVEILVACA